MTPHEHLTEYRDIYFDRATGKTFVYRRREGSIGTWEDESERPWLKLTETPYTFEAATWSGTFSWISAAMWPWLNPMGFATEQTAKAVHAICAEALVSAGGSAAKLGVLVDEKNRITGPFSRTVERSIHVVNPDGEEHFFSAGRIAERIIRHGPQKAMADWIAELKSMGVLK